jgi:hypothetical protein
MVYVWMYSNHVRRVKKEMQMVSVCLHLLPQIHVLRVKYLIP